MHLSHEAESVGEARLGVRRDLTEIIRFYGKPPANREDGPT